MRPLIAIAGLAAAVLSTTASAEEQGPARAPCGVRAEIVQQLADQFGETQREIGLLPKRDVVLELFASGDGLTWTLMLSYPNGKSCLFASGTDWAMTSHAVLKSGSNWAP